MGYRTIFWYLFRQHMALTGLVLACLFLIVFLGQFAELSRHQSEAAGWTALETMTLSLYRSPVLMQAILPHVMLIASALAVARASRRLEVTILLQNGLSHLKILLPIAVSGAVFGLAYTMVASPLSSIAYNASERALTDLLVSAPDPDQRNPREMMLRDAAGANYLLIEHVAEDAQTLYGVLVYRVDPRHSLRQSIEAERAVVTDTGWRLEGARELFRAPDLAEDETVRATLVFSQRALAQRYEREEVASFFALPEKIALGEIVGVPVHELKVQYYWLAALPMLLGGIALMAGALVMRPMQRGGWKGDAALILGAAFTIYTVSTVLDALGARGVVDPLVSTGTIPFLCIAAGLGAVWVKRGGPWRMRQAMSARARGADISPDGPAGAAG